jgi:hypothetical protein
MRTVHAVDAIEWLKTADIPSDSSILGSLPDISEFPTMTLPQWKKWFTETAELLLSRTPDDGVTLFYQSDIKVDGTWVDKAYLCQKAAENLGHELLWHKVLCRAPAGVITMGRPAYSHLLCFSKKFRVDISKSQPDVLPDLGEKTWERGMGLNACLLIGKFLSEQTKTKTLINPFCGQGSMLATANAFGLNAIGIEKSPKRAEKARQITLSKDFKNWENLD